MTGKRRGCDPTAVFGTFGARSREAPKTRITPNLHSGLVVIGVGRSVIRCAKQNGDSLLVVAVEARREAVTVYCKTWA